MRVLVTGGAGYIGSVLVPILLERGYDVRVVDIGLFGVDHLPNAAEVVIGDVLQFQEDWLAGVDGVIHLAGLSNDPMAEFSPRLNYTINAAGTAITAQMVKKAGICRFIFASTCSVYGFTNGKEVAEDYEACPPYPYAISKLMGEKALSCLADDSFRPIILRKGTVVGSSPRMRYDLAANAMIKSAHTERRIVVHNRNIWRPFIDVRDAAMAYVHALDADPSLKGVFNIAYDNFTIGRLANKVSKVLQECGVDVPTYVQRRPEFRNYRVGVQAASEVLGFRATISMEESAKTMMTHIQQGHATDFENPIYNNVEWMKLNWHSGALVR